MRRFIFMLLLAFIPMIKMNAQAYTFVTKSFAIKYYEYSTRSWGQWSKWQLCEANGVINIPRTTVVIYTQKIQRYTIVEYKGAYYDSEGCETIEMSVIDQDGDKGTIRMRQEHNGNVQLYVDFADVSWVYNINISKPR